MVSFPEASAKTFREKAVKRLGILPDWWATGLILLLALLLGGGTHQGLWSDALVQLASLPLFVTALFRVLRGEQTIESRAALYIAAAIAFVPIIQLLPLPPAIWSSLPGRTEFAAAYAAAALPIPWLGISLSPPATWRSVLALIPPVTIFLSVALLGRRSRRALSLGLVIFGFVSVVIGLAQLAQGPASALRFYSPTNTTEAVGFFANRNHFAAMLYIVLPFTMAWVVGLAADRRPQMLVGVALSLLVFASLLLGLGMARSRAGLVLAMLAALVSLGLTRGWRGAAVTRRGHRLLLLGGVVGLIIITQFAAVGIMQRLESDVSEDLRWELTRVTARIAKDFQPVGSGVGTFEPIYKMYEDVDRLFPAYVNHAHDDYVELLLEGGGLAVLVLLLFLGWFALVAVQLWRQPKGQTGGALDLSLQRAAVIGAALLCLHSAVDYPLRTTTLSTLFAFCCALMLSPLTDRTNELYKTFRSAHRKGRRAPSLGRLRI